MNRRSFFATVLAAFGVLACKKPKVTRIAGMDVGFGKDAPIVITELNLRNLGISQRGLEEWMKREAQIAKFKAEMNSYRWKPRV